MDELKPCPLCGSKAKFGANKSCCGKTVRIDCTNPQCGANINAFSSKAEAIKIWNRRAAPENKALTLEQLRQMEGEPVYSPQCRWGIIGSRKIGTDDHGGYDKKYTVGFSYGWEWLDDVMRIGPLYARKPEGSET